MPCPILAKAAPRPPTKAVCLVERCKKEWRREYGRERVPTHVTEGFISEAIDTADEFFGTRPDLNEVRRAVAKNPRTTTADR